MQKLLNNLILKNKIEEAFKLHKKVTNQRKYIFLPGDLQMYYSKWLRTGSVDTKAYVF